jgi:hypothetical protein
MRRQLGSWEANPRAVTFGTQFKDLPCKGGLLLY